MQQRITSMLMLHLYSEGIITRSLFVYAFVYEMMSQLIANGIISNCDVCGGLMFNTQR